MDDLTPVIEAIAKLADKTESDRWQLAEAINTAFAEFPAYTDGLLSGLMERTRYSNAQIYNYRNAWELRSKFNGNAPKLTVSHYSKMYNLIPRYNLEAEQIVEYLEHAAENNLSVLALSREVESNHEPDPQGKYESSLIRFITLGRKILNDPCNKMDKILYANLYDLIKELEKI